jgi:hypothetical protein
MLRELLDALASQQVPPDVTEARARAAVDRELALTGCLAAGTVLVVYRRCGRWAR